MTSPAGAWCDSRRNPEPHSTWSCGRCRLRGRKNLELACDIAREAAWTHDGQEWIEIANPEQRARSEPTTTDQASARAFL